MRPPQAGGQSSGDIGPPLPQNLEAERSILGAILLDNSALNVAREKLAPGDFFLSQHAKVFQSMLRMSDMSQPIDLVSLTEELQRAGTLEAAGGAAYVSALADGLPRVANIEHHARIVKQKAALRRLAHEAAAVQERALAGDEDAGAIVARAKDAFSRIAEESTSQGLDLFDTPEEIENAPPLTFAVQGFLQCEAATLIAGLSGDFKTWIALSVAKSLLDESTMVWDTFAVLHKATRVIYLIPESARGPFRHRLEILGLIPYVRSGKLLVRTLSKGPAPLLQNPKLLAAAQGADVFLDTAVRFMQGDENNAGDNARGLATDVFALLGAGARTVTALTHSPKSFAKDNFMELENMVRGSGDIGAMFATAWGVRQLPDSIVHVQNIKPRDFDPCGPFQLAARPHISDTGNFRMHKEPGSCGLLADEMPDSNRNKGGGAPQVVQEARNANLALLRSFLQEDPGMTSRQLSQRFASLGIKLGDSAIRKYRKLCL